VRPGEGEDLRAVLAKCHWASSARAGNRLEYLFADCPSAQRQPGCDVHAMAGHHLHGVPASARFVLNFVFANVTVIVFVTLVLRACEGRQPVLAPYSPAFILRR